MLSRLLTRREQLVLAALAAAIMTGCVVVLYARGTTSAGKPPDPPVPERVTVRPAADPAPAPSTPPTSTVPTAPAAASAAAPVEPEPVTQTSVTVAVMGAVRYPGTYSFPAGAHVQQALARAGGVTGEADLRDINTAAELIDGSTLVVPARPFRGMVENRLVIRPGENAAELNPAAYTISGSRLMERRVPAAPGGAVPAALAAPAEAVVATAAADAGLLDLNTASEAQLESLPGIGPKLASEIVRYRSQSRFTRVEDILNVSGIGPKRLEAIRSLVTVK